MPKRNGPIGRGNRTGFKAPLIAGSKRGVIQNFIARTCECRELVVKGKHISCPPQYAPLNNDYDPLHHDYEHGCPLIRSLRASAQRSTSVLFSFVFS
jgi:hypothetical protein